MSQPTVFLVFLWIVLQVTISVGQKCKNPCTCTFNDQNDTFIDLSAIGQRNGPSRFFMLHKDENNVSMLYSYNPCYPINYRTEEFAIDPSDPRACSDAAACIIMPGNSNGSNPPTQRAIGYQRDAVFFLDGNTVKINYTAPEQFGKKPLIVTLQCNQGEMNQLKINNETSFTLFTKCACKDTAKSDDCRAAAPSSKSGGLSTGSILLITFFVILLVYVGFGILFNFCKGAHGTELLPNYEFWNELPKLIVDGFLFTCSCFGRRSSYADV